MKLVPSNQSDKKFGLFGLLANRLLYEIESGHQTPDDAVSGAERQGQETIEKFNKALKDTIEQYNKRYGNDAPAIPNAFHEDIKINLADLPAMKKQVEALIQSLIRQKGDTWRATLPSDAQHQMLHDINSSIVLIQSLPQRGKESVEGAHRGRLAQRHELMTQAGEKRELWEKKPAYKELSSVFDSLASTPAFRDVWQSNDGLATQKQREAKQLFLAILAEQTNGFEETFVLGEAFKNDPDENIRNFPFLYNEFLKIEGANVKDAVSPDKIAAAESAEKSARENLKGIDPVKDIVERNSDAGILKTELGEQPNIPDTNGWTTRKAVLVSMSMRLKQKAKDVPDSPSKPGWEAAAKNLDVYVAHAEACLKLSRLQDRETLVKAKFTRVELSTRRRMVMELAMRQFGKSMEMVDKGPFNNSDWQRALHPTVRRMVIASIYENGPGAYKTDDNGKVIYEENTNPENIWMMAALSQSNYFNFQEVGENMDADHEAVLKAAFVGSRIAVLLESAKPTEGILDAWIAVRTRMGDKEPTSNEDKKFVADQMARFPKELRDRFQKYTLDELQQTRNEVAKNRKDLEEFLKETKAAIKEPYSEQSKAFIKKMRDGVYSKQLPQPIEYLGKIGGIESASLDGYLRSMFNLQINFKTAELQDKNMLMFFEGLGMNIEGMYPKYLDAVKKDPKVKAEYWDQLLLGSDDEFKKLITLFKTVIPDSIAGGKDDFIVGLESLRKKYKGKKTLTQAQSELQEGSEDAVVLNVFRMLKVHLTGRAETFAASDRQRKDIEARMNGMHIGDRITPVVAGVWNMLTGPGQSSANRAAGLVLMYGFYKSARMAMKGDGKYGKAMRALFVAGAIEIAAKEITGRGVLDRAGLDSIAGAMEGTHEAVLLQDAEKRMKDKDITTEAHAAALMELNKAPFDQVMAWYESSDPNGMPRAKGGKDLFPRGINLNKIGPKVTWDVKDKKLEARRVVWETVRHFFGYVGDKDNHKDDVHGKEALKERWVTMVNDPNYKPKYSTYDHREWLKSGGVKKSDITWQMVMSAEIDPRQVDLTHGRTPLGQLETAAREAYTDLSEWTRQYVANPGAGVVEGFMEQMGEKAQDAQAFFADVAKATERKVYFTKEKVVFWYKEHEYEIRRVAENHWQLLVTGLKLPFQVVGAVDNWAIPWTLAHLQRIEESLSVNKQRTLDKDLTVFDIASDETQVGNSNVELNKGFSYLGVYQEPFLSAMAPKVLDGNDNPIIKANGAPERRMRQGERFYEDQGSHVGYYISEMTPQAAGVNLNSPTYQGHPDMVRSVMAQASRKKAEQQFKNHGMSDAEVKKYMYDIHTAMKTTDPQKMYVFWRMPLKESAELHLMESGRWADFMDPNKRKDREAFTVDPSQTSWENLQRGLLLDTGPTRVIISKAGGYAAQVPRFMFWNISVAGGIVKTIGGLFLRRKPAEKKAFEEAVKAVAERPEAQKQLIDELFSSAESQHQALSKFYQDPINSRLYKFSLNFAQKRQKPLYLGILQGRKDYEGTMYLENNDPATTYTAMRKYYAEEWMPTHGKKPDPEIEKALTEAEAALNRPPTPVAAGAPARRPGARP